MNRSKRPTIDRRRAVRMIEDQTIVDFVVRLLGTTRRSLLERARRDVVARIERRRELQESLDEAA